MIVLLTTATVVLMVSVNALFVAAEFSTVAARKTRISQMAATGNRLATLLLPVLEDSRKLDNYIAACQLGITASSLVLGAYGQSAVAIRLSPLLVSFGRLAEPLAQSIATTGVLLLFTLLQVVFGELFPKSVSLRYPEETALATIAPVRWSQILLAPFIWFFNGSGTLLLRLLRIDQTRGLGDAHSPEEIELLVGDSHEGGLLDDEERQLLRNAFRMRELIARQVMTPRTRMIAASANSTVLELLQIASRGGYTRIPLYQESSDHLLGFVHVKDLFRLHVQQRETTTEILRPLTYVPETLPLTQVWETLSNNRQYMAIVFDEYGGTAGMITYEDLIEEIFGELQDEFDDESALIAADKEGRTYLRADLLVTDINEYLGLNLSEEQADTIGGLLFSRLGRLPKVGDKVKLGQPGVLVRVEEIKGNSITQVSLELAQGVSESLGEWEVVERD